MFGVKQLNPLRAVEQCSFATADLVWNCSLRDLQTCHTMTLSTLARMHPVGSGPGCWVFNHSPFNVTSLFNSFFQDTKHSAWGLATMTMFKSAFLEHECNFSIFLILPMLCALKLKLTIHLANISLCPSQKPAHCIIQHGKAKMLSLKNLLSANTLPPFGFSAYSYTLSACNIIPTTRFHHTDKKQASSFWFCSFFAGSVLD